MTNDEILAHSIIEQKAWEKIRQVCWENKTRPTREQIDAQWIGITNAMICTEITKLKRLYPYSTRIWLIPNYFSDNGEKTVSGIGKPYSDVRRRQFNRQMIEIF